MNRIFILMGAGFSYNAGLPLAKGIDRFFTRDNEETILKWSSGESKWYDFADDTDRHNGRVGYDWWPLGFILNEIVKKFTIDKKTFISYEEFYQYLLDNLSIQNFLPPLLKIAESTYHTKRLQLNTNPAGDPYCWAFSNTDSSHIFSLINYLISDLLFVRKSWNELESFYEPYLSCLGNFNQIDIVTLNHDIFQEYILREKLVRNYSDGFTTNQNILFSSSGNPLNVFDGSFNEQTTLIKLHGSVDIFKFSFFSENGSVVTPTGEYRYYKTLEYDERQKPIRRDTTTGKDIQTFHFDIKPQFITGTNKSKIITDDSMYSVLYSEFDKRIHATEQILIIGYSYGDDHVNQKIKSAIEKKIVKRIININPSRVFPFENNGVEIINLTGIDLLSTIKE